MKKLDRITLVAIDTFFYGEAISSLRKSLNKVQPAKTLFLTDIKAYNPNLPFEIIKIEKLDGKKGYSKFCIKELDKYFDTDFVLVTQHDSWVLDDNAWDDRFYDYDYIGASWIESDGYNVGNGGFSLRSKKLQHILATDGFIQSNHSAEDVTICRIYRPYLEEKYGIKFAPEEIADKFSYELREPVQSTFGFHSNFHKPYRETVVVKRTGALGDIVAMEPLLEYYHNKGCKVVIDVPLHLAMIYSQHRFPVYHISQITDKRVPLTIVDLDGSYEANPKQLHLKSYYETAGITDGEIKNPQLHFQIDDQNRLFKDKYVVVHNDIREQTGRNIYGVNWEYVVGVLKDRGFTVIQVGMSRHETIPGAIEMRTVTLNMLLYLVAGAELFIGIDSGISNIAVGKNIPSIIFAGAVDPEYIYPDLSNVTIVSHGKVCDTPRCWHDVVGGTTGKECYIDAVKPPCTQFGTQMVIDAINKML